MTDFPFVSDDILGAPQAITGTGDADTVTITVVAGTGVYGYGGPTGDGGPATAAK